MSSADYENARTRFAENRKSRFFISSTFRGHAF
jgi:hypothetical protein